MAVVPICYRMSYKDQPLLNSKENRYNEKGFMCSFIATQEGCGCFSSISGETGRRWSNDATGIPLKVNARKGTRGSQGMVYTRGSTPFCLRSRSNKIPQRDKQCIVCHAYKSNSNEKQLQSLDTYFGKLQHDANKPSSVSLNKKEEFIDQDGQSKAKSVLGSLDDYFGKVSIDANSKNYVSSASNDETSEAASYSVRVGSGRGGWKKMRNYMRFKNKDGEDGSKHSYNETSDFHLISILVSINIAVFLFEIASPIQNSDLELFSLPLLYGAKINHLILLGEWWRLVTPMFLHSGILNVALGCWVLLSFGPRVCRAYGSFTFSLIYILGGISGNLTSFRQTPDPTVGGTGPVFAVIGAWLIYQIQNKEVITKDDSENMLQKAIIATGISCILSNFGPIDDWTHFGAGFTGILYGFLTCPMLRMDDGSSKSGQEEGITLVRQYANPCKSLVIFSLVVLVLSFFLFVIEPPLNSLAPNTFL
ncbi:RHOMBOID-like protein 9, chloroplastic [Camellia sinensis]|uniref:RHOMBOID-like protein 9, chloroplastic n=1 Tax=Camellia sinensis TaxID=4442 RepID=UPI0010366D08|nr:RHOMBOID-like protein 9, chloroplastic [Camellia sinensis]